MAVWQRCRDERDLVADRAAKDRSGAEVHAVRGEVHQHSHGLSGINGVYANDADLRVYGAIGRPRRAKAHAYR